ncbi:hypothetical protein ACFLQI_03070 [Candidatus Undinarchaeota archaeon]
MTDKIIVIAIGGNALLSGKHVYNEDEQVSYLKKYVIPKILSMAKSYKVVLTHGNGPQVGYLMKQDDKTPLHEHVARTQEDMGKWISRAIEEKDAKLKAVVVKTHVLVDRKDEAFKNYTKFVGRPIEVDEGGEYYDFWCHDVEFNAGRVKHEPGKDKPSAGGAPGVFVFRKVVPSPTPQKVIEHEVVSNYLKENDIVIACGGGGIPVTGKADDFKPVDAVIDKDLTSKVLALEIGADKFVVLTKGPGVVLINKKTEANILNEIFQKVGKDRFEEIEKEYKDRYLKIINPDDWTFFRERAHFPPGSIGPKVEAVCEFADASGGGEAFIGDLKPDLKDILNNKTGTKIKKGLKTTFRNNQEVNVEETMIAYYGQMK